MSDFRFIDMWAPILPVGKILAHATAHFPVMEQWLYGNAARVLGLEGREG